MVSTEIFRTLVPIHTSEKKINYDSRLMLLGSCFSEYIGQKLGEAKFTINNNPFGIVYNPFSIKRQIENLIEGLSYLPDDLFLNDGRWRSFDHHSRFSDTEKEACLKKINDTIQESHRFLKTTDILVITFGTSYVYHLKATGQIVSNCHKVPAREFDRKRISVQDIVETYSLLINKLVRFNPNIHIVFTVSPIRHWKDGPHGNQVSKAILLLAIDEICNNHPNTFYFPSYEIVIDELRDYRFYAEDMLHPNSITVNYIWQQLQKCFMKPETISTMKEVEQIIQAAQHKPFHPEDEVFRLFAKKFYEKIQSLKQQFPIHLEPEETYFKSFINH